MEVLCDRNWENPVMLGPLAKLIDLLCYYEVSIENRHLHFLHFQPLRWQRMTVAPRSGSISCNYGFDLLLACRR